MQLGTAFGLAITTIVHNSVLRHESAVSGVALDSMGRGGSREMQLKAYKAAQWTGFGFAMLGKCLTPWSSCPASSFCIYVIRLLYRSTMPFRLYVGYAGVVVSF